MKMLPREAWHYAALLILLFCIAALAVAEFIRFLGDHLPADSFRLAAIVVGALTLGFMLIAGAFGLWAIRFSAEAESRRRIGRLVDAMHYIGDGVVAVDRRGRVSGSNPSAQKMGQPTQGASTELHALFPCLAPADVRLLVESPDPVEVERSYSSPDGHRELRFRSQPAEGLALILISDVTSMSAERLRRRQSARLQLIGELARAVAHDVDNLLCGISGHASLIERLIPPVHDAAKSVRAIQAAAQRGVAASGQLLQLSRSAGAPSTTEAVADHLQAAADNLRLLLPEGWSFSVDAPDTLGPAGIAGAQLEQMVLNMGLIVADRAKEPSRMVVSCGDGVMPPSFGTGRTPLPEIVVHVGVPTDTTQTVPSLACSPVTDLGMLGSVIRSLVEGNGGSVDYLTAPDGEVWFRLSIPRGRVSSVIEKGTVPDEIQAYISRWRVLCSGGRRGAGALDGRLRKFVGNVDRAEDVGTVLAYLEKNPQTDALVIHERVLGHEPAGMLRAFLKLRPECAVVVLAEDLGQKWDTVSGEAVLLPLHASLRSVVLAMVDARGMAVRRTR